ncbi:DUF4215 domain-containing protein [Myxococcota bacterium]|nr:DUF4215 domain-containing protein [Myxococcota bacterium]
MLEIAADISGGGDFEGHVPEGFPQRFALILDAPAALSAETVALEGDVTLCAFEGGTDPYIDFYRLVEGEWVRIGFNDDGAPDNARCALLEIGLPAGEYRLDVRDFGRDTPFDYILRVSLGAVAVEGDACGADMSCIYDLECADAVCAVPVVCGDGVVAGDEECDDGNTRSNDGCAWDCTLE